MIRCENKVFFRLTWAVKHFVSSSYQTMMQTWRCFPLFSLLTKEQIYVTMSLSDLKSLCSERMMVAACSAHQILTFCHSSSYKMYPMASEDDGFGSTLAWREDSTIDLPEENVSNMQKDSCFHFSFKMFSNHFLKCMKEPQTIRRKINSFQRWKESGISEAEMVTGSLLPVQGQRHDLSIFTEVKKLK